MAPGSELARLSSLRLFGGLRPFKLRAAAHDAIAGVTLASMNVPQALGYARIAGAPVGAGLYTLLLPLVAFAFFGSSRHLVVAADSATAAILYGSLSRMTGCFLLLARLFRLGFLADFLSQTALIGFLSGVGVQVGAAMLGDMLGLATPSQRTLAQLSEIANGLPSIDPRLPALSIVVVASILAGKRLAPRFPVSLAVVIASIAASAWFHLSERGFAVIGPVPGGLPALRLPLVSLNQATAAAPVALACFAMIIAQSAATSRAYAMAHGERVDENADILGLAAANAAAVLIALLFLTGPLQYLPRFVLASIVFTIAVGMVDVRSLRNILQESRGEFLLAFMTALAVVAAGVEEGILFAIGYSLVRHVRHSYRAHAMVLVPGKDGRWEPAAAAPGLQTAPGLIVYRYGADLFYANAQRFADQVRQLVENAPAPVRWFVFDAEAIGYLDLSAALIVRSLLEELSRKGVEVVFGRVSPYLLSDLRRHRVAAAIGEDRIFASLHEALGAVRAAGWSPSGRDGTDALVIR